ncbi:MULTISPECIES: TolC family protein [Ramlibacter]|uniref:TolC family protein n=1 Tax=Ramlibacter aquaticus TaxID=2780094 RepID=A0ABR9SHN6_9BURK|nr:MULTISPECIES: TolC family protein [Ramlibacter]MBE7941237.1 TolC family protein [Ramlibacter aquaticus]
MMRLTVIATAALVLGGCASFSADGGFDQVSALTRERTGQPVAAQRTEAEQQAARDRVAELLKQPLDAESAVRLAFLGNRGLQARFAELGIAEADYVRAGRLPNPVFSFGRLSGGGELEIDRGVLFNVLGLLTLPAASQLGQRRFEQAQVQAAADAVGLAADVRRAFFDAVASQQLLTYYGQVKDAAEASNELAKKMVQAGNFNKLTQMREQAFYADATAQLARARHQATADRERLIRLLGLSGDATSLRLPERLPDLPAQPVEARDAERTALEKRLDVIIARRNAEAVAQSLGLTRATRFVNVLDAGYQNKSQTGAPRANGYDVELELPLFDFGAARAARAQATYLQAVNRTAEVAVNAQSEVRESYSAYRTAYDLARHYRDEVVPLRKRISDENLLRYNGMLISVFELIADAREQVAGVSGYVQALRDFWVADASLQSALTGVSPGSSALLPPPSATGAAPSLGH